MEINEYSWQIWQNFLFCMSEIGHLIFCYLSAIYLIFQNYREQTTDRTYAISMN